MLIDVVKSMEMPERIIPTFVWFDRIDSVYGILPHALYFSPTLDYIFRGTLGDRKRGVCSGYVAPRQDKLISQVIESAPEILEGASDDQRNVGRNVMNAEDIIAALSRLRVILKENFIWVGSEKMIESDLRITDMLVGPF